MHIYKRNPLPITINNIQLQYTETAILLGLTLKWTGILPHVKKKRILANSNLKKLKCFRKLSSRIKLHLYKALLLSVIDYPVIPMNVTRKTNWCKLQTIQN